MVFLYSSKLIFISWQPVQNASVLVALRTTLNPAQKITPAIKPPPSRVNSEKRTLGRHNAWLSFLNLPVSDISNFLMIIFIQNLSKTRGRRNGFSREISSFQ